VTPFTAEQFLIGQRVTTGRVPREPRPDQPFPKAAKATPMKSLLLNDLFRNLSAGFLLGTAGFFLLQAA
jgi:hypothetical protein